MDNKQSFSTMLSKAFTTFIPFIAVYSIIIVLSNLSFGAASFFESVAVYANYLIVPILASLIVYYLDGKRGIIPAAVSGLLAGYLLMGFLGGLLVGLSTYGFLLLSDKLTIQNKYIKSYLVPFSITIIEVVLVYFILNTPITWLLESLTSFLEQLGQGNIIVLVMVLGGLTASDLGGPLNKTSFAFTLTAYLEGLYHITGPALIAVAVPPLGIALAVFLFPKLFGEELRSQKKRTLLFGSVGLTEGALPYAVKDPLVIFPSVILGSMLASGLAGFFQLENTSLIASIPGVIGTNNILLYLVIHLFGIILVVLFVVLFSKLKNTFQIPLKQEKDTT